MTNVQFRKKRLAWGLTQPEMAKTLGYSDYRSIIQKEKGERKVSPMDVRLIELIQENMDLKQALLNTKISM